MKLSERGFSGGEEDEWFGSKDDLGERNDDWIGEVDLLNDER
jgi:hypothetical protein